MHNKDNEINQQIDTLFLGNYFVVIWVLSNLKLPATWLFLQLLNHANKKITEAPVMHLLALCVTGHLRITGHLWKESIADRFAPLTKGQ